MGYGVLLVDLDSQGHATKCLGYEGEDFPKTLLDVLVKKAPISEVIQKTRAAQPGLHSLQPHRCRTVDLALMPMAGREFKLRNALKEVEAHYDFIIFDAPPSFGLLNLNALMAADDLLVPVLADFLSFHGLKLLFETVQSLEDDLGHVLDHVFIVVNAFNATFKLAKEALDGAAASTTPSTCCRSVVRQCTKFAQASSEGRPIFLADRDSKGAHDMQALIDEVLKRVTAPKATVPEAEVGLKKPLLTLGGVRHEEGIRRQRVSRAAAAAPRARGSRPGAGAGRGARGDGGAGGGGRRHGAHAAHAFGGAGGARPEGRGAREGRGGGQAQAHHARRAADGARDARAGGGLRGRRTRPPRPVEARAAGGGRPGAEPQRGGAAPGGARGVRGARRR